MLTESTAMAAPGAHGQLSKLSHQESLLEQEESELTGSAMVVGEEVMPSTEEALDSAMDALAEEVRYSVFRMW